jgi:hypothetical protein
MKWRVRVAQQLDQPGRTVLHKVLRTQPPQSGNERRRVSGQPNSKEVGAPLVTSRQRMPERRRRNDHPPSTESQER